MSRAINQLVDQSGAAGDLPWRFCHALNESACGASEKIDLNETDGEFTLLLYNPSSTPTTVHARLPVATDLVFFVKGPQGEEVETQASEHAAWGFPDSAISPSTALHNAEYTNGHTRASCTLEQITRNSPSDLCRDITWPHTWRTLEDLLYHNAPKRPIGTSKQTKKVRPMTVDTHTF
ncbi:hypothetical protein HPB48_006422 [Haemaphysalis longicornis]|uniref:Uncharacterized protein n=1 Tax=Haemaphysalis longicornis TaxID=44386 RepID=A0A9J6FMT1_HAELO|nr:hypothetical protein HPB48_006422 [Haemaphysalis longicornis]